MILYPGEDPSEPSFGVYLVHLAGLNQGVGYGRRMTTSLRPHEHIVLTAQRQFPFILPMSGRLSVSNTDGTPILAAMLRYTGSFSGAMVGTSLWNVMPVSPLWLLFGFWMRPSANVNGGVKTSQVAAQKSATVDMACLSAV